MLGFMKIQELIYNPIGIIHSEHKVAEETPVQPIYAQGCKGQVEIFIQFTEGLKDLEGFSHIYLIYHFHRSSPETKLIVKPFLQDVEHGVFATRMPCRPNAIGLSVVELEKIDGRILHIRGVDILDGTPLLDIKPCTSKFDLHNIKKSGWQDEVNEEIARQRGKRKHNR